MNKKNINLTITLLILFLIPTIFIHSNNISPSTIQISIIFIEKIFPFLFIMMVINNILIKLNLPYYINKIINSNHLYIFLLSILTGAPTNAIIIKGLLDNKQININNASLALCYSTINNPLFLYSISKELFNSVKIMIVIYIVNSIVFAYIFIKNNKNKLIIKYHNPSIIKSFSESIQNTISTLVNIFGTIIFFKLISDMIFPSQNILFIFLKGLIELTQGVYSLKYISYSTTKELLALVILLFNGFSIHMQISLILKDYNINYKHFYISRLISIILGMLIILISK